MSSNHKKEEDAIHSTNCDASIVKSVSSVAFAAKTIRINTLFFVQLVIRLQNIGCRTTAYWSRQPEIEPPPDKLYAICWKQQFGKHTTNSGTALPHTACNDSVRFSHSRIHNKNNNNTSYSKLLVLFSSMSSLCSELRTVKSCTVHSIDSKTWCSRWSLDRFVGFREILWSVKLLSLTRFRRNYFDTRTIFNDIFINLTNKIGVLKLVMLGW